MRFKSRHGIRQLDIQGENLSANTEQQNILKSLLKIRLIRKATKKSIRNWFILEENANKSLVAKNAMSGPGYKASKARITAMFANPLRFKGIKKLPVIYKKQKNSWMDTNIFIGWYDTVFIPKVKKKKHQIATGKSGNALLLIDNATSHPSNISMERENGKFKVAFFPS
ncbi:hypothetical protein LAZ67_16002071 [Cordylochernes scorpioides]|uniref:DDE-1 domain-containing protein n=1 Tax=Cordylochernes scorpioides TaxID=51811 RepID=A0ABY6LBN4_9ARAC|nr:hypothetical protein LAZ67_16002071 [Cordylochernes scorpioides]